MYLKEAMGREKVIEKPWAYALYKIEGKGFVLSVLCGTAAMYELNIPVDDDTAARMSADEIFLETYANEIREHPARYSTQSIRL